MRSRNPYGPESPHRQSWAVILGMGIPVGNLILSQSYLRVIGHFSGSLPFGDVSILRKPKGEGFQMLTIYYSHGGDV